MAAVMRRLRLPASPVEHSAEARIFAFCGLVVAVVAMAVYGNDVFVPALSLGTAALGHLVSYRERLQKRGFWRQALLAALIFGAMFYLIADSGLALFGGTLPQAHFAIVLDQDTKGTTVDTDDTFSILGYALTRGLSLVAGQTISAETLTRIPDADIVSTTVTMSSGTPAGP